METSNGRLLRIALRELVAAVASMRVPQTVEDAALQVTVTLGPALRAAQDALASSRDETFGDTVPRSRYDACNRDWLEAKAKYDGAAVLIGNLAALIPLSETIAATRNGESMVQWFKEHLQSPVEPSERPVFNHERDCGLTNDAGTCECPQPKKASGTRKHAVTCPAYGTSGSLPCNCSEKATDDIKCHICGKLWRSEHTDQERADCSAAL